MKISLKWLNDLIAIDEYIKKPEPLADILTKAGLEIESIENRAKSFEKRRCRIDFGKRQTSKRG